MSEQPTNPNKTIEYVAPPQDVIRKFTDAVCDSMNEIYPGEFSSTQVRQGFFQFINVVIDIQVKNANRENK